MSTDQSMRRLPLTLRDVGQKAKFELPIVCHDESVAWIAGEGLSDLQHCVSSDKSATAQVLKRMPCSGPSPTPAGFGGSDDAQRGGRFRC